MACWFLDLFFKHASRAFIDFSSESFVDVGLVSTLRRVRTWSVTGYDGSKARQPSLEALGVI